MKVKSRLAVYRNKVSRITLSVLLLGIGGCALSDSEKHLPLSGTDTNTKSTNKTQPNIVWIVSEDNSASYLDLYSEHGAPVPAISELAEHGIVFKNAFSNAPVCSVARTTLQTGIYAPQLGTQYHRAFQKVTLPSDIKLVHEYLREAGYHVTNQSKTDYNLEVDINKSWDESSKSASWKDRTDPEQPFFYMHSPNNTHESRLHFDQKSLADNIQGFDLSQAKLPKYFPDTETFRYTQLYYKHLNQIIDKAVGNVIQELDEADELEDTFIFYFADHGGVLPRSKGYVYNSGLQIPLVVRIPKNFKHMVEDFKQKTIDGSVEFIDFAPTVLNLAGIKPPKHMIGKPFLGPDVSYKALQQRSESFGYNDRLGAKYDFVRSLKMGNYHYIRSYQPNLPDALHNQYRYKMLAYSEWRQLYKNGQLNKVQSQMFEPKPVEMLFDLGADPDEVINLTNNPKYLTTLLKLRAALNQKVKSLPDLGFLPESYLVKQNLSNTMAFGQENKNRITEYIDIANLQYQEYSIARPKISEALQSKDPIKNLWGLSAALAYEAIDEELTNQILSYPIDKKPTFVIARYSEVLGKFGLKDPHPLLAKVINQTDDEVAVVELFNSVVYLHDFTQYPADIDQLKPMVKNSADVDFRMGYLKGTVF